MDSILNKKEQTSMTMEAYILGCSGMQPLPNRFLTSVLLKRDGDLFLFDCGEGTQITLRSLSLKWKRINAIFISHTHADHVTGLPGILMLSAQVDRTQPLYIYGPPKIAEYIETSCKVLDINYPVIVKEITAPGIVCEDKDYVVRSFALDHTKECVGYTLEEKDRPGEFNPIRAKELNVPCGPLWSQLQSGTEVKATDGTIVKPEDVMGKSRKGRKFSFVTDTLYSDSIAQNVKNSDLLVCEAMFENELIDQATEKKHMTAGQCATVARDSHSKKMAMIHYSPRYADEDLPVLEEQAKEIYPNAILSKDKMLIDIPYED